MDVMIKSLLDERRRTGIFHHDPDSSDLLGDLLAAGEDEEARKDGKDLSYDMIVDNTVMLLFAAFDTTSNTLLWIIKIMNDYPDIFRRLQVPSSPTVIGFTSKEIFLFSMVRRCLDYVSSR